MLVNLNDVLRPARAGKYGVGLFNAVNLEMAKGVLQAAEEKAISAAKDIKNIFLSLEFIFTPRNSK